jgi:large subunit ribosomal protein L29
VKAEDLRTLDTEELGSRLKGARRELYELRFKLAVGQLDDHRQIRKVRKDIARILTVVHARRLGEEVVELPEEVEAAEPEASAPETAATEPEPEASAADLVAAEEEPEAVAETPDEETPENVEAAAAPEAPASPARRTGRTKRARSGEEGND